MRCAGNRRANCSESRSLRLGARADRRRARACEENIHLQHREHDARVLRDGGRLAPKAIGRTAGGQGYVYAHRAADIGRYRTKPPRLFHSTCQIRASEDRPREP